MAVDFDYQGSPTGAPFGMQRTSSGGRSFTGAFANNPILGAFLASSAVQRLLERSGSNPLRGIAGGGLTGDPDTNFIDRFFETPTLPEQERVGRPLNSLQAQTWGEAANISPAAASAFRMNLSPNFEPAVAAQMEQTAAINRMREQWFNEWRDQMGAIYGSLAGNLQRAAAS